MKYKNYGDNNKEFDSGLGLEFLTCYDDLSARSENRPILNLNENQEEIYALLNSLIKTVYGNVGNAIIPSIDEELDPEGLIIGSFLSNKDDFYLRIPTGAILLTNNKSTDEFSKYGEKDYSEKLDDIKFTNDVYRSYVYSNKPNINLLERQLANSIALDLSDEENDIKVYEKELPIISPIFVHDDKNLPITDNYGNFENITDGKGHRLYVCSKDSAEYFSESIKKLERPVSYDNGPQGADDKGYNIIRYYISDTDKENIRPISEITEPAPEAAVYLTADKSKAERVINNISGKEKIRIGYNLKVVRNTPYGTEEVYLPNKAEKATWNVSLKGSDKGKTYTIRIYDDDVSKEAKFTVDKAYGEQVINNKLYETINNSSEFDQLISADLYETSEKKPGVNIKVNDKVSNKDLLKLEIVSDVEGEATVIEETTDNNFAKEAGWTTDETTGTYKINKLLPKKSVPQEYYYNTFELVNNFLAKFSPYLVSSGNVYNYMSGETIVKIGNGTEYFVYYDLDFNSKENGSKPGYDKSGRIFISNEEKVENNLIKLFKIEVDPKDPSNLTAKPRVKSIKTFIKTLDKRLLNTKRAELNSLLSSARTEFTGKLFSYKDKELNTEQKMVFSENNPLVISSNRIRITNKDVLSNKKATDAFQGNGDTYNTTDYKNNTPKTEYYNNANDKEKGFVISDNGMALFSNDEKPINISSTKGTVNIKTNDITGLINISNDKDKPTNSINITGLTKISSKNENQLTVKSLGENPASINFNKKEVSIGSINFDSKEEGKSADISISDAKIIEIKSDSVKINKATTIDGTLTSTGKLTVNKDGASITGDTTIKGATNITGDATIDGATNITGNTKITGTLTSTGKLTVEGDGASITGDTTINGATNVSASVGSNSLSLTAAETSLTSSSITIKEKEEASNFSIELKSEAGQGSDNTSVLNSTINKINIVNDEISIKKGNEDSNVLTIKDESVCKNISAPKLKISSAEDLTLSGSKNTNISDTIRIDKSEDFKFSVGNGSEKNNITIDNGQNIALNGSTIILSNTEGAVNPSINIGNDKIVVDETSTKINNLVINDNTNGIKFGETNTFIKTDAAGNIIFSFGV